MSTRGVTFWIRGSLLATSVCVPAMAHAQSGPPSGEQLDEMVVTAQKRSETLQKVPVSVSAFDTAAMKTQNANTLENISLLVPGMQISQGEGKVVVSIRGISTNSIIGVAEQAVATHIDGFYVSRTSALSNSLLDVERVEVLKGPQGTLYGRNATAGTINVINKKPTDQFEFSGLIEGTYFDDNGGGGGAGIKAAAVVNIPINQKVHTRIAMMKVNRDGYMTGIYPGGVKRPLRDANEIYGRAEVSIDVTDKLNWLITSDNYWADDHGFLIQITGQSRPDVQIYGPPQYQFIPNSRKVFEDEPVHNGPRVNAITSTLEWQASDRLTLRSLTQYRYNSYAIQGEFDSTQAPGSAYIYRSPSKLVTQEVQANLELGRLHGVAGVYFYHEDTDLHQYYRIDATLPGGTLNLDGGSKTTAYAAFGDVTYSITDKLDFTLGGRLSYEKKAGSQNSNFSLLGSPLLANMTDLNPAIFRSFTPKAVINYKPTSDLTLYASAQRGFKSGGFNIGALTDNSHYKPEGVDAYEVGAKMRMFDRRLILNLAGFYYDYKHLQVEVVNSVESIIRNAAKARIKGVEFDGEVRPVENLTFSFSGSVLDAKAISPDPIINPLYGVEQSIKGNQLPRASKFSGSVGAAYDFMFAGGGRLTPNFTASYRSHQYLTIFNDALIAQDAYWWLRASITYRPPNGKWSASLYGDNLTDQYVLLSANPAAPGFGYGRQSSVSTPRIFGLRFDWNL